MKEFVTIKQCSDRAASVARAVLDLVAANVALEQAMANVPNYTGQWDRSDYYAEDQEHWNVCAENLLTVLERRTP